ncbi:MAG: hypothetical protein IPP48_11175 [Chitinophagaceae bacterium]|nr:hypothetical protein [Chitinophagaceae bacterium]
MNIEFQTPYKKVPEKLISLIRNEILEFSHLNKKISKAEVHMREDKDVIMGENIICDIWLTAHGDNIHIHSRAENFELSAKEAIKDLRKKVRQLLKKQSEKISA